MPKKRLPKSVDRRPPEIQALDERIRTLHQQTRDAEDERHTLVVRLVNANPPLDLEGVTLPFDGDLLATEPVHECEKCPSGHCVYDDDADPAHDHCIYCHEPYERK